MRRDYSTFTSFRKAFAARSRLRFCYRNGGEACFAGLRLLHFELMIRPFNLRDWALVHRLSEQGVLLHTESALTRNLHPVRDALFSIVGGDFPTYVWKAERGGVAGFVQLYVEDESQNAHLLYLSSTADQIVSSDGEDNGSVGRAKRVINETVWLSLLDKAVIEAGRQGFQSLIAEVSETGAELPVLRRAGFAVYTRQDVWVLKEAKNERQVKILSPRQSTDDWEIQLLYANTVPRLVQLVEPMPPLHDGEGWVLRESDELTAFIHIRSGPVATWMRLFIHPNAEAQADEIMAAALQVNPPTLSHPVYCCVRRYQSWVQHALQRTGFELWGSQAVMVKHMVHHLQKPIPDLAAVLEAQGISPSAPLVQRYQPGINGKMGR